MYATQQVESSYSTISSNLADVGAGLSSNYSRIINSTISSNQADESAGGVYSRSAHIYTSTVAENTAANNTAVGGIQVPDLLLHSTIVALNISGNASSDVLSGSVSGANNLVGFPVSTTLLPADTLRSNPFLAGLADNGEAA